jgi:CubicO group peptidase (beta-lactamase class C family)
VSVDDARRVLERAIDARVFPAAAFDVGPADGFVTNEVLGAVSFDEGAQPTTHDTIFDLASLTKPIATTSIVMALIRSGTLTLDARVADFFEEWRGADRERVTVRDLLEHASGLPARLVDQPPATRREFEHDICAIPLEYQPRARSVYSDLGFILLGFLLERVGSASLADMFEAITRISTVDLEPADEPPGSYRVVSDSRFGFEIDAVLSFGLPADRRVWAAPTLPMDGDMRRGRVLAGEVHDNYAAALGGVAGHAGLFGTANGVSAFARALLRAARHSERQSEREASGFRGPDPFSPDLVQEFLKKSIVPGSSRALGWDTMLPTSSCGTRMSPQAFGHVGFTGTSLWIDPARGVYFVLLTNRADGGGTLDDMRTVRRAFHDALGDV